MEENPEWYRHFCSQNPTYRESVRRWRQFKTAISRRSTEKALQRIINGRLEEGVGFTSRGPSYIERLVPEIRRYLRRQEQERKDQLAHHLKDVPFA